jgi:RNA polymerase sigma factor FliA
VLLLASVDKNKLWVAYSKTPTPALREQIIIEYAPLVKLVAGRLSMYLGYNVEYDDLVGYGVFGLIDAIDKFDYGKGIKFETYASLRIRGSILDQIRKMDWIPRSLRQKQKKIDVAMSKLEAQLGRPASDEEIAKELEITAQELLDWQGQANVSNMVSLDEFIEASGEHDIEPTRNQPFEQPEEVMEKAELKKLLAKSLEALTDKEKKVILLYYYEDLTLKEISRVLKVSESRISQLHTKALQKMKVVLGQEAGYVFSNITF